MSEIQLLENIEVLDSKESFYVATLSASTHGLIVNKAISEALLSQLKRFQESLNMALMITAPMRFTPNMAEMLKF